MKKVFLFIAVSLLLIGCNKEVTNNNFNIEILDIVDTYTERDCWLYDSIEIFSRYNMLKSACFAMNNAYLLSKEEKTTIEYRNEIEEERFLYQKKLAENELQLIDSQIVIFKKDIRKNSKKVYANVYNAKIDYPIGESDTLLIASVCGCYKVVYVISDNFREMKYVYANTKKQLLKTNDFTITPWEDYYYVKTR